MQKPFVVTTYEKKTFYSSYCILRTEIFSFFPIVKMNANYAEFCRVGKLEVRFSTSSACSFFLIFSQYCCETSKIQIQERKVKSIFSLLYRNCIGQTNVWPKFYF